MEDFFIVVNENQQDDNDWWANVQIVPYACEVAESVNKQLYYLILEEIETHDDQNDVEVDVDDMHAYRRLSIFVDIVQVRTENHQEEDIRSEESLHDGFLNWWPHVVDDL